MDETPVDTLSDLRAVAIALLNRQSAAEKWHEHHGALDSMIDAQAYLHLHMFHFNAEYIAPRLRDPALITKEDVEQIATMFTKMHKLKNDNWATHTKFSTDALALFTAYHDHNRDKRRRSRSASSESAESAHLDNRARSKSNEQIQQTQLERTNTSTQL